MDLDVVLRQSDLQALHHSIQGHWLSHVVGSHEHVVAWDAHVMYKPGGEKWS